MMFGRDIRCPRSIKNNNQIFKGTENHIESQKQERIEQMDAL